MHYAVKILYNLVTATECAFSIFYRSIVALENEVIYLG